MATPKIVNVYYNHIKNCKYMFKNGKAANFLDGKYYTDIPHEIEELDAEIASGHEFLFVNLKELTVDLAKLGKIDVDEIKRQAVEEYIKSQQPKDMGKSEKQEGGVGTGIKSSADIAGNAPNSNSASVGGAVKTNFASSVKK